MNEFQFQDNFFDKQLICEYFGNVLLATDYSGEIVLIFCNGEIITFQLIEDKWLKTGTLRLIPQIAIIKQDDYSLQLNGNGTKFFLLQVDQRYEQKIQIWHRHHKSDWRFQQSLKVFSRSSFLSINLSGSMLCINHQKKLILWEFNYLQTKLTRAQSINLETSLIKFNEFDSVIAARTKTQVLLLKKFNDMWIEYQSIETEQNSFMQFLRNRLIVLTIYDLLIYKMDDQLNFVLEKQIKSGLLLNEPQQCLFIGSIVILQMPSLELECFKYENNMWYKEKQYFRQKFEAQQVLQSKDNKKLFIYRKRYGAMVFQKKNEIKAKIKN